MKGHLTELFHSMSGLNKEKIFKLAFFLGWVTQWLVDVVSLFLQHYLHLYIFDEILSVWRRYDFEIISEFLGVKLL